MPLSEKSSGFPLLDISDGVLGFCDPGWGEGGMASNEGGCDLSAKEAAAFFSDPSWAAAFPPILTVDQAAALAQVPKQTIYSWSSQGLLVGCSQRIGKHLRILRNKFILKLFNEGLHAQ